MTEPNHRRPLLDHWLWDGRALRVFVVVALVIPVAICCTLLPLVGTKALFVLIFLCFGPVFGLIYRHIGRRVDRIAQSIPPDEGDLMPGLIVQGAVQSPGIVILGRESLTLRPIAGGQSQTPLSKIESVREVRWFNGSWLPGKTGFWLTVPGGQRLGCAVPDSYAGQLRTWLAGRSQSASGMAAG